MASIWLKHEDVKAYLVWADSSRLIIRLISKRGRKAKPQDHFLGKWQWSSFDEISESESDENYPPHWRMFNIES